MPWTFAGETISQPGVIANINNSAVSAPQNTNSREQVIIGSAGGGQPKTVLSFSDPTTAQNVLQSGEGLTAVLRALNPSSAPGRAPGIVKFVRVDPAVQSSYAVVNGATTVINLKSVGYGSYTNRISTQITSGTTQGLKATVTLDSNTLTQDNLYKAVLSVQYTGSDASALLNLSNSSGNMTGSSGASGSETVKWTADFTSYKTIQQLVNYINAQTDWTATILTASPNKGTANTLDDVTDQTCKSSAYTVTGTLQAAIDWYNTTNIVTASRPAGVGSLPSIMTQVTYLSGGSDGTATNQDWSDAFAALQNEPLARIVTPISGDSAIHAMGDAHCALMSEAKNRNNRVQIAGGVQGEQKSAVLTRAQNLNSRRTTLVWPGIQDIDAITGVKTTYDPYIAAAQAGGILSSLPIASAVTRESVRCIGLEGTLQSSLTRSDYDDLVNGGVMAIKFEQNSLGSAYRFVRSVTTWLQDTKLVNVELSCVANEDAVTIRVGDAVEAFVGKAGTPLSVGRVKSVIDGELRDSFDDGWLVGDKISDAYNNIQVSLSNGFVTASYNGVIPAPMNAFGVTSNFSLYSSSAA